MTILIFGNAGSGKTTLARRLGAERGLTVLDLDNVVWSPTEDGVFRPDSEIAADLAAFVCAHPAWVIEGCYGRWMEHLLPHCTEIIFLNPSLEVCLANCHARPWEPNKFKTREEQDQWLPALLDWVRAYYTRTDDLSLLAHRRLFDSFHGARQEIHSKAETASILGQAIPLRSEFLPMTTERLVLRRFTGKDAAAFCAYRGDPEIARYQSWDGCSTEEAREFVEKHAAQPFGPPGEWMQIAIALKSSNELIGDCGVRIGSDDARQATIGVTLARQYHGRGFASEALVCLFDHLLREMGLHRIVADIDSENIAMQRLAGRLGMRREGHLRQSLWFKGGWADELFYALLRDEWLARDEPKQISLKTTS